MSETKRILVTGSGSPVGVNVTRSLHMASRKPFVLGTEASRYHIHLSLADETAPVPPARDGDAFVAALQHLVAEHRIDMILPTDPLDVRTVSVHRALFARVRLMLPPHEAIAVADDRWRTYRLLRDAGLPVPVTRRIERHADLESLFAELTSRPIWVRSATAPGIGMSPAALPCREVAHAAAWVAHHRGWGQFLASEYLPGRTLIWCGVFYRGELVVGLSRERLESVVPPARPGGITGTTAVTRTVSRPDVHEASEAAVRALPGPPHGVYGVELQEDAAGTARITEIRAGRFGTTVHFFTEAGCNLVEFLTSLALGQPLPGAPEGRLFGAPLVDPIAPGTYWIRSLDRGPVLVRDLDGDDARGEGGASPAP
jgi:carbamoyl-phosphate synthase large subunit